MAPDLTFRIPARTRFRNHEHEGPHLCAVLDGGFVERGTKTRHDVGRGMVRVTPSARHDIDFGPEGARCLLLALPRGAFERLDRWVFVAGDRRLNQLLGALAIASDEDTAEDLQSEVSAQVLRRLDGRVRPAPEWLVRVRDRLRDGEAPDVAALAASVGVHRVHLARAFHDHYGIAVSAFRRRVQVRKARDLIRTSDLPLSRIAADAGFADQSHLTRAFRRAYGQPPAAWRRDVTSVQDTLARSA